MGGDAHAGRGMVGYQEHQTAAKHLKAKCHARSRRASRAKRRSRPTHFLALPLSCPLLQESLRCLQDEIVEKGNIVEKFRVPPQKAHITLAVVNLEQQHLVQAAVESIDRVISSESTFLELGGNLSLSIKGLSSFGDKVVFAHAEETDPEKRGALNNMASHLNHALRADGFIPKHIATKKFNPHVTLFKTSRLWQQREENPDGESKNDEEYGIPPDSWKTFRDINLGGSIVTGVELLKMRGTSRDRKGYYPMECFFPFPR
jgi:2'-5' RNA ligase